MAFQAVFPRVMHLAFGPGLATSTAVSWWQVTGKTCVAAYQAIGAASLAASYINLANPGTYDAAVIGGDTPGWTSATGWRRTSGVGSLDSGIDPTSSAWTFIFRFSNLATGANSFLYIGRSVSGKNMAVGLIEEPGKHSYYNPNGLAVIGSNTSGVYAIAGQTGYYNGASEGSITGAWTGAASGNLYLLTCSGLPAGNYPVTIYVQSAAIYSDALTAGEVATVSAAMAALTG